MKKKEDLKSKHGFCDSFSPESYEIELPANIKGKKFSKAMEKALEAVENMEKRKLQ